MTMPDRIQITHAQPMTTPTTRAALTPDGIPPGPLSEDDLRQRWNVQADEFNQWESLDSCEQLAWAQALAVKADRHAAALKAEPRGQRPTDEDFYDLAAEFDGDPVPATPHALEVWGNPLQGAPAPGENLSTPPAPETPAEALAARPLLERVAQLGDVIGRQTVAQVQQLANQAALWLRENPPGQPVAIEPIGCPAPGACSCVEPTPPAPEKGEVGELLTNNGVFKGAHGIEGLLSADAFWEQQPYGTRLYYGDGSADYLHRDVLRSAATLLKQQEAELAALRNAARPTYQDAIRLAQGCHDYSGGHTGPEGQAWHGAIDTVVNVLKRSSEGPWDSQTRAVFGVGAEARAGEVEASGRRPESDWVDSLQHAIESKENDFLGGVCASLAVVTAHGEATVWREIVRSVGTESLLNYAANVNPEDWDQGGFSKYAQAELGKGKPDPAPQAGKVALAGDRQSAESLQLAHESCRSHGIKNGDCPDNEICWLDMLPCSHYENCATIPAPQAEEVEA